MAKVQPSVMALNFRVPSNGISWIDLNYCLSLLNRRFYRQSNSLAIAGIDWHVAEPKAGSGFVNGGFITVDTLPHTWVCSNAWEKGFRAWDRMNKEFGLTETPSIKPRFYDFKIFMNEIHYSSFVTAEAGFQNNFTPVSGETLIPIHYSPADNAQNIIDITDSEWDYSKYEVPSNSVPGSSNPYHIYMTGSAFTGLSVGLIQNYAQSRAVPISPDPEINTAGPDNIWTSLFDQGTEQSDEVLASLADDNDELPYSQMNYPGGSTNQAHLETVDQMVVRNTIGLSRKTTGSFTAPCGLLQINSAGFADDPADDEAHWMTIYLAPGPTKGYLTQPMKDM